MTFLLDIAAAAESLGISPTTLRRLVARGLVAYRRVGSQVRFTESDLAEYVDSCRVSITPKADHLVKPPILQWLPLLSELRRRT
jgi:excisionase family DNA binding protein